MPPILVQHGGAPLDGTLRLDGSKHCFAHVLSVAALADEALLRNVPDIVDVQAQLALLRRMFGIVDHDLAGKTIALRKPLSPPTIVVDSELAGRSRSLYCLLPAMLKRAGHVVLEAAPEGCAIGTRPTDWYAEVLERFGASCARSGDADVFTLDRPRAADIRLEYPSMTASVIAIAMAAMVDDAPSSLANCTSEQSVDDALACVVAMGGEVDRDRPEVRIGGPARPRAVDWTLGPDRVHAATYLSAAMIVGGNLRVDGGSDLRMPRFIEFLEAIGAGHVDEGRALEVRCDPEALFGSTDLQVGSEPLFSTDWAPFAALVLAFRTLGESRIADSVFTGRFQFSRQLREGGLDLLRAAEDDGPSAAAPVVRVTGSPGARMSGGTLNPPADIRGSAALLLAGLTAREPLVLRDDFQLRRGYADIGRDLTAIGVDRVEGLPEQ